MPIDVDNACPADSRYADGAIRFSICTLVNDAAQYRSMVDSFRSRGFCGDDCEFLFLDNTEGNNYDAYHGINLFLQTARGDYVVICHQDVALVHEGREVLEAVLRRLERDDPRWGLFGNAGATENGSLAIRITDPHGIDRKVGGPFPVRAQTLDENFLVIKRAANLAVSAHISGFHLYGTDLCQIAQRLGYSAYVVDFHLHHFGAGNMDEGFFAQRAQFMRLIGPSSQARWITTVCTEFPLTDLAILHRWAASKRGLVWVRRLFILRRWVKVAMGLEPRSTKARSAAETPG